MKHEKFALIIGIMLVLSSGCKPEADRSGNSLAHISDTKVMQYALEGKLLYGQHCANCHKDDGKGLGKLIPPLNPSDYMVEDIGRTVRLIKNGMEGEIMVNGNSYNQAMPANPKLTNIEIAQISTYLYNIWGNEKGLISIPQVEVYLKE
ncbi:cytochrome c [Rhodonellum sp.]|uniref:c-type cytochrome n=1 Tax=Rhodonellum sp. TaxID=2231180 RepID=UPI00271D3CA3|nr:cytochrome c [Rhodonellum sp.]MDO9551037.1 cytochrome c [Rhodonellum sp.]